MHIRDFHLKFVSCTEECDLLGVLRRLSRLESPQALSDDDTVANDWIVWTDAGSGRSQSPAPMTA